MKKKPNLIRLILFIGLLSMAFSNATAQEVPVHLVVHPNKHIWYITFTDNNGGYYEFQSTDDILDDNLLGSIPPGTYNIDFYSDYWWDRDFDYGIETPSYYHWHFGENYKTVYNVPVDGETWLYIDPR